MSEKTKEYLLLLFDRPTEPVFHPKGRDKVVFDIPESYLTDYYRGMKQQIYKKVRDKFGKVQVVTIDEIDISEHENCLKPVLRLRRDESFSLFRSQHRKAALRLSNTFINMESLEDMLSLAIYLRDRTNLRMFFYAYSVALLHKPDTKDLPQPSFIELFPEKYIDPDILNRLREEMSVVPEENRRPIFMNRDKTATDLDFEHRLWYFREDPGVNLHHWHWHSIYPADKIGDSSKDRRGELFYYMHQQMLARYNIDRLCNKLARTKALSNLREPITEGYFPKLRDQHGKEIPPRFPNISLSEINRGNYKVELSEMERWRDRIYEAIHKGFVITKDGKKRPLCPENGIDILGNLVEASEESLNKTLYGDLHNMGHMIISFCHDPDNRYLESVGVMGEVDTAMRDPVFYRWHAFIDNIFQEHKNQLKPYTEDDLEFEGVKVKSAQINTQGEEKNLLVTTIVESDIDLSRAMSFAPTSAALVRFYHLNHKPFTYNIQVENHGPKRQGTCRIFLAPKFDEGHDMFEFKHQKHLFIEMDKFVVTLMPNTNNFVRKSSKSSVTVPYERIFPTKCYDPLDSKTNHYCSCGWPEYMLVPKGKISGLECQLFVMISDYEKDRVDDDDEEKKTCKKNAASFCGLRDSKYPDKRAMGYPFDRKPRETSKDNKYLRGFLTPNMAITDVVVKHIKSKKYYNNVSDNLDDVLLKHS